MELQCCPVRARCVHAARATWDRYVAGTRTRWSGLTRRLLCRPANTTSYLEEDFTNYFPAICIVMCVVMGLTMATHLFYLCGHQYRPVAWQPVLEDEDMNERKNR